MDSDSGVYWTFGLKILTVAKLAPGAGFLGGSTPFPFPGAPGPPGSDEGIPILPGGLTTGLGI